MLRRYAIPIAIPLALLAGCTEVAELRPETQGALLRVIEGKGFRRLGGAETLAPEVRLIAATHRDLAAWVQEGRFREDPAP